MKSSKRTLSFFIILLVSFFIGQFLYQKKYPNFFKKQITSKPAVESEVLIKNLEIPWEVDFLPGGEILLTERSGNVLLVNGNNRQVIPGVVKIEEAGLLGMAIHPQFELNKYIYLYFSYQDKTGFFNKVERFLFDGKLLIKNKTIIDKLPASANHDGGRIKFGPDGKLYITTGETQKPNLAQDLESLGGKILRLDDEGNVPEDNPFPNSFIYSYGHRNPQGIAWDSQGNLWATEHGQDGQDEINLIKPGKNYGWPIIQGDQKKDGLESPILNSKSETWAPSGAIIVGDKLYFAGLAGRSIYVFDLKTKKLSLYFQGEFGRLRSINYGPDNNFYLITSNLDGRNPNPDLEDDRLIKVNQFLSEE